MRIVFSRIFVLFVASVALAPAAVAQNGLSFHFGDEVVGAAFNAQAPGGNASMQLGWLHHDDDVELGSLGIFADGKRGIVLGRMGVKIHYSDLDHGVEGYGLAFGGAVGVPMNEITRIVLSGFYGPSASSFDDIDGYSEWSAGLEINLFGNSAIEVGYGVTKLEPEQGRNFKIQDGVYGRLKLLF